MKKLRLTAALLALLTLAGCGETDPAPVLQPEAEPIARVAYVPLDDRPVNLDRVAALGESLGYEMLLPEVDWFHSGLDQQTPNENGTLYGDRGQLLQWVLDREAEGCDRYILSLDQLLSGGLVNSRSFAGADIVLPDGTVYTETEAVDLLLETLSDPENRVYLLDTVMRLAPTVGYDGWDLTGYELLRQYGMAERPKSSTVEEIVANYPLGADGRPVEPDPALDEATITAYLAARERKLRLIDHALTAAADMDHVQFLIGVDDSAPSASIQTSEITYLKERAAVLSGADEDGMLAVCRMYADLDYHWEAPQAEVRYFGGSEDRASSDFDHQPMTEIVDAHLDYLGVEQAAGADLQVLVLTAPAEGVEAKTVIRELTAALGENAERGIPTILMDAAKNAYGTAFQTAAVEKVGLGFLLGYGGYYDLANVTGVSLANGVARWLCLREGLDRSAEQERAFQRTLADSLIKDICYKNDVKNVMAAWIRSDLAGDPDNFAKTDTDPAVVLEKLSAEMDRGTGAVLANLERSNLLTDLCGGMAGWGSVALENVRYPWQRVFEVRMDIRLGSLTAAHKEILGFYYQ